MIFVSNWKMVRKSCISVEFNGRNLSKLRTFVQRGRSRAMLDAHFLSSS